jgi:hypothetical protein
VVSNGESAVLLSADLWPWAAAAVLLLLLWPGTLLIRRRGRHITVSAEPADRKPATPAAARQALRRACSADNPQAAAAALLDWAAGLWPQSAPVSLGALAARLRAEQGDAVRRLDQVLYAGGDQHWQGVLLWQVMAAGPLAKTAVNSYPGRRLPPLYPRADT